MVSSCGGLVCKGVNQIQVDWTLQAVDRIPLEDIYIYMVLAVIITNNSLYGPAMCVYSLTCVSKSPGKLVAPS